MLCISLGKRPAFVELEDNMYIVIFCLSNPTLRIQLLTVFVMVVLHYNWYGVSLRLHGGMRVADFFDGPEISEKNVFFYIYFIETYRFSFIFYTRFLGTQIIFLQINLHFWKLNRKKKLEFSEVLLVESKFRFN